MHRTLVLLMLLVLTGAAHAEPAGADARKEHLKGLDEQVQEIKGDVLGIAAELNRLEEKLLFPSGTQVSLFVSLIPGEKFRLDAVDILLDGKAVAHHVYNFKELEALQLGGVQRIYTGNITTGDHQLQVNMAGKAEGGADYRRTLTATVSKEVAPRLVEVKLAGPSSATGIEVKAW
jgi:hypothetical protein